MAEEKVEWLSDTVIRKGDTYGKYNPESGRFHEIEAPSRGRAALSDFTGPLIETGAGIAQLAGRGDLADQIMGLKDYGETSRELYPGSALAGRMVGETAALGSTGGLGGGVVRSVITEGILQGVRHGTLEERLTMAGVGAAGTAVMMGTLPALVTAGALANRTAQKIMGVSGDVAGRGAARTGARTGQTARFVQDRARGQMEARGIMKPRPQPGGAGAAVTDDYGRVNQTLADLADQYDARVRPGKQAEMDGMEATNMLREEEVLMKGGPAGQALREQAESVKEAGQQKITDILNEILDEPGARKFTGKGKETMFDAMGRQYDRIDDAIGEMDGSSLRSVIDDALEIGGGDVQATNALEKLAQRLEDGNGVLTPNEWKNFRKFLDNSISTALAKVDLNGADALQLVKNGLLQMRLQAYEAAGGSARKLYDTDRAYAFLMDMNQGRNVDAAGNINWKSLHNRMRRSNRNYAKGRTRGDEISEVVEAVDYHELQMTGDSGTTAGVSGLLPGVAGQIGNLFGI